MTRGAQTGQNSKRLKTMRRVGGTGKKIFTPGSQHGQQGTGVRKEEYYITLSARGRGGVIEVSVLPRSGRSLLPEKP